MVYNLFLSGESDAQWHSGDITPGRHAYPSGQADEARYDVPATLPGEYIRRTRVCEMRMSGGQR